MLDEHEVPKPCPGTVLYILAQIDNCTACDRVDRGTRNIGEIDTFMLANTSSLYEGFFPELIPLKNLTTGIGDRPHNAIGSSSLIGQPQHEHGDGHCGDK
jgi:hypothetical protein